MELIIPAQARNTERMAIERTAPEPLYRQLAAIIRSRIESGEYPERTAIPPLTQLETDFGVSKITVRKAVDLLKEEGVLTGVSGRGTFVA